MRVGGLAIARVLGAALAAALLAAVPAQAAKPRLPGIDVSRFQEQILWPLVAEDGIRFAYVQASRGSGADCSVVPDRCGPDPWWTANYLGAREVGIRVGAYHRAFVGGDGRRAVKQDAKLEADVFLAAVGGVNRGDLRPALDLETPFAGLDPNELRLWARTWLWRVRRALGVKPVIYTNNSSWSALGHTREFARAGYPLWVANWNVKRPLVPARNWAGRSWRIWQYTSSGKVSGIKGRVDRNWLRGGWRGVSVHKRAGTPPVAAR